MPKNENLIVAVSPRLKERIENTAECLGIKSGDLVRYAVLLYLDKKGAEPPVLDNTDGKHG